MPDQLTQIARRFSDGKDPVTRLHASGIYELHERYFHHLADQPVSLLELGVHLGASLKTFATYFTKGRIVGIDATDRTVDFSDFPSIAFRVCDQRDGPRLAAICAELAPDGFDIIIDDASHIGLWSLAAYRVLFDHLKPGGFYVVEDWGTGYWDDWPDGSHFQQFTPDSTFDKLGKRIPSHDFGMVGFVKYLVDEVAGGRIRPASTAPRSRPDRMQAMHVHKQIVVLEKAQP
jgi:SAM-dependent methyltransferase